MVEDKRMGELWRKHPTGVKAAGAAAAAVVAVGAGVKLYDVFHNQFPQTESEALEIVSNPDEKNYEHSRAVLAFLLAKGCAKHDDFKTKVFQEGSKKPFMIDHLAVSRRVERLTDKHMGDFALVQIVTAAECQRSENRLSVPHYEASEFARLAYEADKFDAEFGQLVQVYIAAQEQPG